MINEENLLEKIYESAQVQQRDLTSLRLDIREVRTNVSFLTSELRDTKKDVNLNSKFRQRMIGGMKVLGILLLVGSGYSAFF